MTFNTLVLYYSRKGNTKALVDLFEGKCLVDKVSNIHKYDLNKFPTIIFATSTYGRGIPPKEFFEIRNILSDLEGKKIGLFGSGNTHYEYFCGALDLIEKILLNKNTVLFKYKYEGYPKDTDFKEMEKIINDKIN